MKTKIAIYLAGSIQKGHERKDETYWTEADLQTIRNALPCEVSFLNPAFRTDDLSDERSIFGRDMLQVFSSDAVFVDARDRRGLGVGSEMMWAKFHKIPVVSWAPLETHYHKSHTTILGVEVDDFIHPFVAALSDRVVETVADGASWIWKMVSDPFFKAKGVDSIASAIQHYKNTQLESDLPMKELMACNEVLRERINGAHLLAQSLH